MTDKIPQRIIISRTDAIGDVVLTLPLAGRIKEVFPNAQLLFLGKTYTRAAIDCCSAIDEFVNYDTFEKETETEQAAFLKSLNADVIIHVYPRKSISKAAKDAGVPMRIGTRNRVYHWTTCNRLVTLSRKNSGIHEALLNMVLLKPLGIDATLKEDELFSLFSFDKIPELETEFKNFIQPGKINLILHPKSHGSAREWSLEHFEELIKSLPAEQFQLFITGGEREKEMLEYWVKDLPPHVKDVTGRFTLPELIAFIQRCDGVIAASTGPLHIAAALGKFALGLYPPIQPMDPSRWAPIGKRATYLVVDKKCDECRLVPEDCHCMNEITSLSVKEKILFYFPLNRQK